MSEFTFLFRGRDRSSSPEQLQKTMEKWLVWFKDLNAKGLIVFKDRLGAVSSRLKYFRYPVPPSGKASKIGGIAGYAKIPSCVPTRVIATGGRLLYKHFG